MISIIMANNTSQHILSTSANLLGFCLFVITSFHVLSGANASRIDEFTAIIAIFFAVSSLLSFLSIRTKRIRLELLFESIADYLFIIGLMGIIAIIVLIALDLIR